MCCGDQGLPWMLFCGCHCPVRGKVCLLVCWSRGPLVFFLAVFLISDAKQVGVEHSRVRRSHQLFLLWSFSVLNLLYCVPFHPLCGFTEYTIVCSALGPTFTIDMPAVHPGDTQAQFSPGQWSRSTEVRSQDCKIHAPGLAMGTIETVQPLV